MEDEMDEAMKADLAKYESLLHGMEQLANLVTQLLTRLVRVEEVLAERKRLDGTWCPEVKQ